MPFTFYDCTGDTTISTGVGTLSGTQTPPLGYRTPSGASVPNGAETVIRVENDNGTSWEVCNTIVTVSGGNYSYSRGNILASSNSNARVNFGTGTKRIYYTVDAEHVTNDPRLRFASMSMSYPRNGDDITLTRTELQFTVVKLVAVVVGTSPSVDLQIGWSTERSGSPTYLMTSPMTVNSTTTGNVATTFLNSVIPAGSFVRCFFSNKSGTINYVEVTLSYQ